MVSLYSTMVTNLVNNIINEVRNDLGESARQSRDFARAAINIKRNCRQLASRGYNVTDILCKVANNTDRNDDIRVAAYELLIKDRIQRYLDGAPV